MFKKRLIGAIGIVLLALIVVSVAEPSLFEFLNPIQSSPLPDTMTVYTYGANGLVSKQKGSDVSYYHKDNLGSSSLVTDSSGEVVYSTDYYPFGSSLHEEGEEKYTYNSKELDDTGLYYYGARYYDAGIGRFISTDPVAGDIFNSQRLNMYSYTLNNPLKYVDVNGESPYRTWEKKTVALFNIGSSAIYPLVNGIFRGDSAKDIAKNTLVGALTGAASFGIKSYAGSHASTPIEMLGIGLAQNYVSSVHANAMRNIPLHSELFLDYGPLTLSRINGDLGLGLNVARAVDIVAFASIPGNKFNLGNSLLSGVPTFNKDARGLSAGFGGALSYPKSESYIPTTFEHEHIHNLQSRSEFGIGRGMGKNWNPSLFGLKLYGLENIKGSATTTSLFVIEGLQTGSFGGEDYYQSDFNWKEREAYTLTGY